MKNPGNATVEEMSAAYATLVMTQNYMNYFNLIHESLQMAPGVMANELPSMIKKFSNAKDVEAFVKQKKATHDKHLMIATSTIGTVVSLAAIGCGLPPVAPWLAETFGKRIAGQQVTKELVRELGKLGDGAEHEAQDVLDHATHVGNYLVSGLFGLRTLQGTVDTVYGGYKIFGDAMS
jgi:hypothetical protein